jgi:glutamate---cysteine ligase / carboxylate-amine ligase
MGQADDRNPVIDIQENPLADIAVLEWVINLAKALVNETWTTTQEQQAWSEKALYPILMETIKHGELAVIRNADFLSEFGLNEASLTAGELCRYLFEELNETYTFTDESRTHLNLIFEKGPLARRILEALPGNVTETKLFEVWSRLCDCLRDGESFVP